MKRSLTAFVAVFLLTLTVTYAQNQQDKDTDKAQRLTTGRITNIDTKKRILKVRTAAINSESIPEPQDPDRRRRNDGGFPGTGGGGGRTGAEAVASDFRVVLDFPAGWVFLHRVGAAMAAHLYREIREENSKSQLPIKQF